MDKEIKQSAERSSASAALKKEDWQNSTVIKVANLLSFSNFIQNSKETYL